MKKLESERREAGHHDAKGFLGVERPECVTSPVAEPEEPQARVEKDQKHSSRPTSSVM
jgi:hypothetical protein